MRQAGVGNCPGFLYGKVPVILVLAGLFAAAFVAATLVPFQSEIIFVAMQVTAAAPIWALVVVASIGNTLGSFVNYAVGVAIKRFETHPRFPFTPAQMVRAEGWFARWGVWTLLLSWAPVGDVITVMAGVMRTPFWMFALLVSIAKTGRYVVLALLTSHVSG